MRNIEALIKTQVISSLSSQLEKTVKARMRKEAATISWRCVSCAAPTALYITTMNKLREEIVYCDTCKTDVKHDEATAKSFYALIQKIKHLIIENS